MLHDPELTASKMQREAFARALDTLRTRHTAMVAKLSNMPVPPSPVAYYTAKQRQWLLNDYKAYLRAIVDAIEPVIERVSDDACDYGGAKAIDAGYFKQVIEDEVIALITREHDLLEEER